MWTITIPHCSALGHTSYKTHSPDVLMQSNNDVVHWGSEDAHRGAKHVDVLYYSTYNVLPSCGSPNKLRSDNGCAGPH